MEEVIFNALLVMVVGVFVALIALEVECLMMIHIKKQHVIIALEMEE